MFKRHWFYVVSISFLSAGVLACGDDGNSAPRDAASGDGQQSPIDGSAPPDAPSGPAPECEPASGTELTTVVIASGDDVAFPVFVTAPAGDPRLFVVEKCGRIRIIDDGQVVDKPFLDISNLAEDPDHQRVNCDGNEEGLLGMAFHPDYASNGRFFVNYIEQPGGNETRFTVVAEYRVSSDSNVAEANEERIIRFHQPRSNHNAGMLAFGPDGYLYIATGDGGGSGDPDDNGQDETTLLGSMLRLDVSAVGTYGIPADNPYASSANGPEDPRPEIWAIGLRNPWRYSFDRETGDLYIGDVGQGHWEEINVQPASSTGGENYGWNTFEGNHCYPNGTTNCDTAGMTMPVAEYPQADIDDDRRDKSVTGGYVYRGQCIPDIRGWYFYADYGSHRVRTFEYQDGEAQNNRILEGLDFGENIVSFGEDAAGELYVVNISPSTIRKVVLVRP